MSKLSLEDVRRIATLARIGLSDAELTSLNAQLSSILDFVDDLQKVDTADVEPTSQVTGLADVLRDDEVRPSVVHPADLLACAPETEDGFVKARRVL